MEVVVKHKVAAISFALMFAMSSTVQGEVLTWSSNGPFERYRGYEAFFDKGLIGVTDIRARVTGQGGIGHVACLPTAETFTRGWNIFILFDNGAASFSPVPNEPFDYELQIELTEVFDEWRNLDIGYAFGNVDWWPILTHEERLRECNEDRWASVPPVIESLTVTVTCDAVVANGGSTWGALKALFR
jgi:hypothetical protein